MFGRAWPFRAPVEDGIVPLWPQLSNSLGVPCMVSYFLNLNFLGCNLLRERERESQIYIYIYITFE